MNLPLWPTGKKYKYKPLWGNNYNRIPITKISKNFKDYRVWI